ncbi:NAD-dependent protein deacetylase [Phycicoccus endophyticus]|uniref:NAD-dependent protein deacetylase n=1 Tax=Phycicoccus endophyticus TaxID=1690220 RepID=A0A7G9R591_9MICO|nr:NAD-dependent protein deacetylase [Phycicoccus endophyticus]NHI20628.1 NAD-dependent protein deacetylase [Phycicoccus endophyticus]QNN50766.1 NAD-dependent protein deacetylase [Phycicoccus endophyticus]GGL43219.1 NAD-dependent protein deacetylase [Phycicoccus endophyticus]
MPDAATAPPWSSRVLPERTRDPSAVERLGAVLREHPGTLVLTGAGISTDSGIPDYRGPDGTRRVTPMQHGEFCASSENRRRYWARSFVGWQRFSRARPNSGHHAVAALQRAGVLGAVVTQNVDGLHQAAGSPAVTELHGTLAEVVCLSCDARCARDALQARMARENPGFEGFVRGQASDGSRVSSQIRPDGDVVLPDEAVAAFRLPRCLVCGGDALKPDVVFFGGSVPRERVEACFALTDAAPALLVLGSSLAVMSGLRFVRRAARRGIPVMAVTRGPSRGDEHMSVRVDGPLAPTLARLVSREAA